MACQYFGCMQIYFYTFDIFEHSSRYKRDRINGNIYVFLRNNVRIQASKPTINHKFGGHLNDHMEYRAGECKKASK